MRAFFIEPSWALCQFFPKLPSCIISVGSQNTMTPMQHSHSISVLSSAVTHGTLPSKSVSPERPEACAAQCYFSHIQIFLVQGPPRRLWLPWEVTKTKNPLQSLSVSVWWAALGAAAGYQQWPALLSKPPQGLCNVLSEHGSKQTCAWHCCPLLCPAGRLPQTLAVLWELGQPLARVEFHCCDLFAWHYTALWNKACSPARINTSLVPNKRILSENPSFSLCLTRKPFWMEQLPERFEWQSQIATSICALGLCSTQCDGTSTGNKIGDFLPSSTLPHTETVPSHWDTGQWKQPEHKKHKLFYTCTFKSSFHQVSKSSTRTPLSMYHILSVFSGCSGK